MVQGRFRRKAQGNRLPRVDAVIGPGRRAIQEQPAIPTGGLQLGSADLHAAADHPPQAPALFPRLNHMPYLFHGPCLLDSYLYLIAFRAARQGRRCHFWRIVLQCIIVPRGTETPTPVARDAIAEGMT